MVFFTQKMKAGPSGGLVLPSQKTHEKALKAEAPEASLGVTNSQAVAKQTGKGIEVIAPILIPFEQEKLPRLF